MSIQKEKSHQRQSRAHYPDADYEDKAKLIIGLGIFTIIYIAFITACAALALADGASATEVIKGYAAATTVITVIIVTGAAYLPWSARPPST